MKTVLGFSLTSVPIEFKQRLVESRGRPPAPTETGKIGYNRIGNHFYGSDPRVNEFRDAFNPCRAPAGQNRVGGAPARIPGGGLLRHRIC